MKKKLLDFTFRIGLMLNGVGIGMYVQTNLNQKSDYPIIQLFIVIGLIMTFVAKNQIDKMEKSNKPE